MAISKFQKIVIGFLIFSQLTFWPFLAFAFVSTATGPATPIPINDSGSLIANTTFDGGLTPIRVAYAACNVAMKTFEAGDNAAALGFSFSALIGGNGALVAQLQAEITAYNVYLNPPCLSTLIVNLDNLTAPNIYTSTLKQALLTQMKSDAITYQDKLKTAHARFNVASQSVWKALLITILINTTKSVADQLVNKLVNNYKIANIKAYTDSLATLAYDNQYIRDNFPGSQDQLMARAILENPLFRSQVPPGIFAIADNALGFVPADLNANDPNFYAKMASVGFAQANPYFLHMEYVGRTDQARTMSLASAEAHIAQGNGYKAPVNCAGSLAQQQQIDLQSKAAADRLDNAKTQLADFTKAQSLGQTVNASELASAQSNYAAALAAWNNVPFAVAGQNSVSNGRVGGGNNTEGNMAIVMCEAVASPAVLVNQGIDALFKAVSANISQYNSNNLPGFLAQIGGIATQIGSSMVLGGITGKSLVNENRAIAQAVVATENATVQTLSNNGQANLAKGIDFEAAPNSGTANSYTLSWQLVGNQLPNASYVTITGDGITGAAKNPLSGNFALTSTVGGNYLLTVYDALAKVITTATLTITLPSKQAYNNNPNTPAVAGAFTVRPLADVRGPALEFHPR